MSGFISQGPGCWFWVKLLLFLEAQDVGIGFDLLVQLDDGAAWAAEDCPGVFYHRALHMMTMMMMMIGMVNVMMMNKMKMNTWQQPSITEPCNIIIMIGMVSVMSSIT